LASLRQVEHERAPFAYRTRHLDFATEPPCELAADRQAQSGAAVLPARGAVRLLERLEDDLMLLPRDADASVDDAESQDARGDRGLHLTRRPPAGERDLELDAPPLGELERVRQQV